MENAGLEKRKNSLIGDFFVKVQIITHPLYPRYINGSYKPNISNPENGIV